LRPYQFMKSLLLLLFLLPVSIAFAQKNKKDNVRFFVFDENWKNCKVENARYLSALEKINDTTYELKNYNFKGPLVSIETYKDAEASVLNGELTYYGPDGKIDSTGYTRENKKNDWWYYYDDSSRMFLKEQYSNGKLLKRMDTIAMREESEKRKAELDTTIKRDEIEASFNGGDAAWGKYLSKNIDFPERARNLKVEGTLMVQFIIAKDGSVTDAKIIQSVEYSIDEEALRVIKNAPKWKPARQDGKFVKAYRKQPLTFRTP